VLSNGHLLISANRYKRLYVVLRVAIVIFMTLTHLRRVFEKIRTGGYLRT
jgi:hypothetical protein